MHSLVRLAQRGIGAEEHFDEVGQGGRWPGLASSLTTSWALVVVLEPLFDTGPAEAMQTGHDRCGKGTPSQSPTRRNQISS